MNTKFVATDASTTTGLINTDRYTDPLLRPTKLLPQLPNPVSKEGGRVEVGERNVTSLVTALFFVVT